MDRDRFLYTCQYCGQEYKPKRRKKQKYCSDSCRVRAFQLRKQMSLNLPSSEVQEQKPNKVEAMSAAGIGNAAAGTMVANGLKSLLTREENKPATKKDLNQLAKMIRQRYYPVKNMPSKFGTFPYYDLETQSVVYLKPPRL